MLWRLVRSVVCWSRAVYVRRVFGCQSSLFSLGEHLGGEIDVYMVVLLGTSRLGPGGLRGDRLRVRGLKKQM